ncbi:histidine phosphatase family protein [Trueperella pecoris]|uniref:Histidine phosphatase family protein n=1 Tax=Trueperella pecoris TaxID=2733571 RepID=A0A7M1R2W7_9ACTO|nr:histidine phosphatase family protein [Trueperella pecoris]QOR48493.1 histidine phosphatase family protein [Trueperella pecoris]
MQLILVRHGQTYLNAKHTLDTAVPGAALTEEGWTQANDVVATLAAYEPQAIWASNLTRTQQTATPLATRLGLDIQIHEGFREIAAGALEGGTSEEDYFAYTNTVYRWLSGEPDVPMGGDREVTGASVLRRFDDAVRAAEASAQHTAVVFSHGGAIAYWVGARSSTAMVANEGFIPLTNTGFARLEGTLEGGYRLKSWMHVEVD